MEKHNISFERPDIRPVLTVSHRRTGHGRATAAAAQPLRARLCPISRTALACCPAGCWSVVQNCVTNLQTALQKTVLKGMALRKRDLQVSGDAVLSSFRRRVVWDDGSCWLYAALCGLGVISGSGTSPSVRDQKLDKLCRRRMWRLMGEQNATRRRMYQPWLYDAKTKDIIIADKLGDNKCLSTCAPCYNDEGVLSVGGSAGGCVEYAFLSAVLGVSIVFWEDDRRSCWVHSPKDAMNRIGKSAPLFTHVCGCSHRLLC